MRKVCAIIVAAGSGRRFGAPLPKQFCELGGRPVLMTTIDRMRRAVPEAELLLVLSSDFVEEWGDKCRKHGFESPEVVIGGDTRWQSVKNAVERVAADTYVLVHDGARPFVMPQVTDALIGALDSGRQGAVPVVDVVDSLRETIDGFPGSRAVQRSRYKAVQTPQAFLSDYLHDAYSRPYRKEFTDDASVMESAGYADIALVEGHSDTFKITLPRDLAVAGLCMDE